MKKLGSQQAIVLLLLATVLAILLPGAPASAAGNCTVSSADYIIGSEEYRMLDLINAYRQQNGVPPLALSASLTRAAAWMTRDMARNHYTGHTDSLGRNLGARQTDCGYTNPYTWRGENGAAGSSYITPEQMFSGWQGSPGHNALMLHSLMRAVGIKRLIEPNSDQVYYWIMEVASVMDAPYGTAATPTPNIPPTPTRTPAPTPVVIQGERLVNPSFESGISGWTRPDWFSQVAGVTTLLSHTGSSSFRFVGQGPGGYVQQSVPVTPGESITLSGWVNVVERRTGMSGVVELMLLNSNRGTISTYQVTNLSTVTAGWVLVETTRVMPSAARFAQVRIRFQNLNGTVYADDFSIR